MKYWELYSHESDIGVRGIGRTCAEAFEQAALALTAIVTEPAGVQTLQQIDVSCEAPDIELLLVDWLNALIYEMATRHMLFSRYEVKLDKNILLGLVWGETLDVKRHRPVVEPKGATYTDLMVRHQSDGSWVAQCVVDV